jgi:hypothetical protein
MTSEDRILGFFARLEPLAGLLGALTDQRPVQVTIGITGSEQRVLLDLKSKPFQVVRGKGLEGDAGLSGSPDDLAANFQGHLGIIEGIAARRLLLRGGMRFLVMFFPVLELMPVMYAEHLRALNGGGKPGRLRRGLGRVLAAVFSALAWVAGRMLRRYDRREVFVPLSAMARGGARFEPAVRAFPKREAPGGGPDNPLDLPRTPALRRLWLGFLSGILYLAGWKISLFKNKLGVPVDLFRVLAGLSAGLARKGA